MSTLEPSQDDTATSGEAVDAGARPPVVDEPAAGPSVDVASRLEGTFGPSRAKELHDLALAWNAADGDIEVDCEALEHLDAGALQILVALREGLGAYCRFLTLRGVPERVAGTIRLAGLGAELLS